MIGVHIIQVDNPSFDQMVVARASLLHYYNTKWDEVIDYPGILHISKDLLNEMTTNYIINTEVIEYPDTQRLMVQDVAFESDGEFNYVAVNVLPTLMEYVAHDLLVKLREYYLIENPVEPRTILYKGIRFTEEHIAVMVEITA